MEFREITDGIRILARAEGRRRALAGHPGCEAEDLEQATGTVVQAAAAVQGGWDAIVSMQIASSTRDDLFAHAALAEGQSADAGKGIALQVLPLPYELLADI